LGGAEVPSFVDGRSLVPLLTEGPPPATEDWRRAFLVEAATELGATLIPLLSGDQLPEDLRHAPREDWGRPGLEAVRTEDHIYAEYGDGERELYDLEKDPYQRHSLYGTDDPEVLPRLREQLAALRGCSAAACKAAEDGR
jgi:N-acetylglucosamine-6-sulfatase